MTNNDTLGKILKRDDAVESINSLIRTNNIAKFFQDPQFAEKDILEIFSRSNRSWSGWAGFSTDHSPEYQNICASLINKNLIDSHLHLPTVKNFVISHIEELFNPLDVLGKIAENSEERKLDNGDVLTLYQSKQNDLLLDCHALGILNKDAEVPIDLLGNICEPIENWINEKKSEEVRFDGDDIRDYVFLHSKHKEGQPIENQSAYNKLLYGAASRDFKSYLSEKPKFNTEKLIENIRKQDDYLPTLYYKFSDGDFSNVTFSNLDLKNCFFDNCNFDKAKFIECQLDGTGFEKSSLIDAQFSGNRMKNTLFTNTTLDRALFGSVSEELPWQDDQAGYIEEKNANIMTEVKFDSVSLEGTIFSSNKISEKLHFEDSNEKDATFDNLYDLKSNLITDSNNERIKYGLPLSKYDYLPEHKEEVIQAQKSAIKSIRACGIGAAVFCASPNMLGAIAAPTIAYGSTYIDTYFVDALKGNSKEPISGNVGARLTKFGQIGRLIDSEVKKDITDPKLINEVIKAVTLLSLVKSTSHFHPALGGLIISASGYYSIDAIRKSASGVSEIYDRISPQIDEIWQEESLHTLGEKVSKVEKEAQENYHQAEQNVGIVFAESKKLFAAAFVGAACFLVIAGLSVATGGLAPAAALAVGLVVGGAVAVSSYMGHEPAKEAMSNFSKFCSKSYKNFKKLLGTESNELTIKQNISPEISSLVSDNSPDDKKALVGSIKKFNKALKSHGASQDVVDALVKAELTIANASSGEKHDHALEAKEHLNWTASLIKAGDSKKQEAINITTTPEDHKLVTKLGKALKDINVKHTDKIVRQEEAKLSKLTGEEHQKEVKNIEKEVKIIKEALKKRSDKKPTNSSLPKSLPERLM